MLTNPTPDNCEIFCARRVSARSSTLVNGSVFEVSAKVMIGASAGLILLYIGGFGRLAGKKFDPALMAACTSCSATSMFKLRTNCSVMIELPAELIDVIWFK